MAIKREYRTVKLHEVKPYPGNARRGDVDLIRGSLRELDQYKDIIVQKSTDFILAGNHTWLAAQAEGRDDIDIAVIDVDDATARKIVAVDNRANDKATYDPADLAALLEGLDGDFTGTGFDQPDLDKLLDSLAPRDLDDGGVPPIPVGSDLPAGALFQLGQHRLICGRNDDPDILQALFEGEPEQPVALTVTSPPYNQNLDDFKPSGMGKNDPTWTAWVERMADSYEDSKPEPESQEEQVQLLNAVHDLTRPGGAMVYNHKVRYRDKEVLHPYLFVIRSKWTVRQEVVWDRAVSITFNARMFIPRDERLYWLTKDGADWYFANTTDVKNYGSIWHIAPRTEIKMSAPFPTEVPHRAIESLSERGDLVFEPYSGTGTTIIAAETLARRCFAVEVNPVYVMAAVHRWQALTGETAERIA
jgi:DNA modification methylase